MFVLCCLRAQSVYADIGLGTFKGTGGYEPDLKETEVSGAAGSLSSVLSNAIGFMTIVAGLFFVFYFIIGTIAWITSGGETQKLEEARKKMTNAAIGMVIVVASYSIIYIVGQVLGVNILNIKEQIEKVGPTK